MKRRIIGLVTCFGGLGAIAYVALAYAKPQAKNTEYIFETASVTKGDVRRLIATTGAIKPRETVQIGSEVSGRIKEIISDFNAPVKAGDVLAIIDPKTFEAKAMQAKADLLSAEASLVTIDATIRKAKSQLANAEKANERNQALGQKGIAARANVDGSERDLHVARAEVDISKGNLEVAKAMVAQKTALLQQAQIDVDRTYIRSPISGIVMHRSVDVGQTVAASLQAPELFRIAGDLSSIHIEAQVSEVDIGAVAKGQSVSFHVDAYPGRVFSGKVEQIRLSPASADSVVTYGVIITADNGTRALFPGMTAHVQIETASRKDVSRIDVSAIRFSPPKQLAAAPSESGDQAEEASAKADVNTVVRRWTRRLQLDAEQVAKLNALVKSATDISSKEGASAKSRVESQIAAVLRPDQLAEYEAYRGARQSSQRAMVWVLSPSGLPEKRSVKVGLSDTKFVELTGNELKSDEAVIVRSRKAKLQ